MRASGYGVVALLMSGGCLSAPPASIPAADDAGQSSDAHVGCDLYEFADDSDFGVEVNDGCDVHIEGGHVLFDYQSDNGGCWIELDRPYEIGPEGWASIHYGDESDLSVVFEVYSPIGNLVVNRWGTTFELDAYNPITTDETELDSIDWDDGWRVWRFTGLDGSIAVSAGSDEGSLEVVLSGEAPFDSSAVGVLIGAFDCRTESLTATFDDLEICP